MKIIALLLTNKYYKYDIIDIKLIRYNHKSNYIYLCQSSYIYIINLLI